MRLRLAALLTLASFATAFADGEPAELPQTPAEPVTESLHGEAITDAYRWLEGDDEGKVTPRVAAWTDAQNAYTRAVLDALPGRAALAARLEQLMTVGWVTAPTMVADRYFFRRQQGTQNHGVLYVRDGRDGEPRVLLDPNTLHDAGLISLDWVQPNQDGSLLAFGLSEAGDENSILHVLDVETGEWLADTIEGKVGGVDWLPGGRSFVYSHLADIEDAYSRRIRVHTLGRHARHDPLLIAQEGTTWGPFAYPSRDARWLIVGDWTSTSGNDLWVADFDRYRRTGELVKRPILVGENARSWGPIEGDTLFMKTHFEAPNGRVVAVDLNHPADRDRWVDVIPHRDDATLRDVSMARGMLVATYLKDACSQIACFTFDGRKLGDVALPGIGSASITTADDRTEAYLTYTSFNEPRSIYRLELPGGEPELWERSPVEVDPSIVEVSQVWYDSKDGTKVSMFLVHKKGLELDGDNPTLLYGYGGFNNSMTPRFSSTLFPWFERGGVYAVPNLRGGGEYGEAWHKAGMLDQKQNVFDDFIAAAEWLIAKKYTQPSRLAISGGSNGGLLTGAALVQRPDLFAAVISNVPLLDMLRYHRFLMARFWVPEYGSSEDAEQFAFLKAYSPYHHIKEGASYPAVLLTAGENDKRVHPLHARKMAAALQAATGSDDPVLLWVDRDAGHGQGKPLSLRIRDVTDQRIFLMWRLGMLERDE